MRIVSVLFAEVDLGIIAPFTRNRFFSDAQTRDYTVIVPPVVPFANVAAGLAFP
jgi:hypothetical protein